MVLLLGVLGVKALAMAATRQCTLDWNGNLLTDRYAPVLTYQLVAASRYHGDIEVWPPRSTKREAVWDLLKRFGPPDASEEVRQGKYAHVHTWEPTEIAKLLAWDDVGDTWKIVTHNDGTNTVGVWFQAVSVDGGSTKVVVGPYDGSE